MGVQFRGCASVELIDVHCKGCLIMGEIQTLTYRLVGAISLGAVMGETV